MVSKEYGRDSPSMLPKEVKMSTPLTPNLFDSLYEFSVLIFPAFGP